MIANIATCCDTVLRRADNTVSGTRLTIDGHQGGPDGGVCGQVDPFVCPEFHSLLALHY